MMNLKPLQSKKKNWNSAAKNFFSTIFTVKRQAKTKVKSLELFSLTTLQSHVMAL